LAGISTSTTWAADAGDADLQNQIHELRQKLDELQTKQSEAASRAATAAQVDRAVAAAIEDAKRNDQFLAIEGFTAGHQDGFKIQSADGTFLMQPSIFAQFRFIANARQDSKNGGSDDYQSGFEIRRLKFALDGNLWSKDLTYRFQWNTSRTNGTLVLDEGFAKYHFAGTPWALRVGTFANAWDHETENSSKKLLAVERSLVQNVLVSGGINSENYVQGVELTYDAGGDLRAWINYNDGINSRNTAFTDGGAGAPLLGLGTPSGAVSGRVTYKFLGDWKDYLDSTALGTKKDLLVVGGGFDYESADNVSVLLHTVDVQYESAAIKGLALSAAYYGAYRDFRTVAAGVDDSTYEWGALAQASYLIDPQWEIFARYDFVHLNKNAPSGTGTLGAAAKVTDLIHEITLGVNYYLKGHAAKFTIDGTYLPNGCPIDLNGAGILSQPNDKAQFLLRAQFQLLL
jgi:hypothetical protein